MQANLPAPLCCSDLCLSVALEPATSEESLCRGHTAILALYKQTVLKASEEFAASGRALPSRTVVLELDRNPLKTFGGGGVGLGQDPITAHFRPTTVSS